MKKIMLCIFILSGVWASEVNAQCSISQSSIVVNIHSITSNGTGCTTVFDLTYDISNNGGNKWSYIHLWDANKYPGITYGNGSGPTRTTLDGGNGAPDPVLTTVAIDYTSGTPVISGNYGPDPTHVVPQTTGGITVTRTAVGANERFFIQNISVASSNCNPLNLKADVWSAQDQNGKNVACAVTGLQVRTDEPLLNGSISCNTPRAYTLLVQTKNTNVSITWTAYKDVAPFGVFDASDQANVVDGPRTETNPGDPAGITYNPHGPYSLPGGAGSQYNIWVVVTEAGISNSNSILLVNTCSPLPVNLVSFNAARNNAAVLLNWETSTEINNSGFAIERNTTGTWEQVGFVNSLAQAGNSTDKLDYQFTDINNFKGISEYRLREVDMSGQSKYSMIRTVRSASQSGKIIIYPNPSTDGSVNISFDQGNVARNISIIDLSGKLVKQLNNVTDNTIKVDNLEPGLYNVRVIAVESGEQSVGKFVVNKR
jgi:hypothetical protein